MASGSRPALNPADAAEPLRGPAVRHRDGQPVVSVIIPAYNSERYVAQAIDSVVHQSFTDYEVIVVDDGSTDATAEVVQRYADRVRFVRQPNGGNAAARNRGLSEARGRWICFLDADDVWHERKLEIQLGDLLRHPAAGFSFTRARKFYDTGEMETIPDSPAAWELWDRLVFYQPFGSSHSGLMVRRSCLEEIGGFDESLRLSVDWDLFIRLARRYAVRTIPDFLMNHRQHSANTTGNAELRLTMYLVCLRKHRRFFCQEWNMRKEWHRSYGARLFRFGRHFLKQGRCVESPPLLIQSMRYGGGFGLAEKLKTLSECLLRRCGFGALLDRLTS